jgi:hypothetical protein
MELQIEKTEITHTYTPVELSFPAHRKFADRSGVFFFRLELSFYEYDDSHLKGLEVLAVFHNWSEVGTRFSAVIANGFFQTARFDDEPSPQLMSHDNVKLRGRKFAPSNIFEDTEETNETEFDGAMETANKILSPGSNT